MCLHCSNYRRAHAFYCDLLDFHAGKWFQTPPEKYDAQVHDPKEGEQIIPSPKLLSPPNNKN